MTCLGCNRLEEVAIEVDGLVVCDQCIPVGCARINRNLPKCVGGRCRSPADCPASPAAQSQPDGSPA